jgi:hypothetical protein
MKVLIVSHEQGAIETLGNLVGGQGWYWYLADPDGVASMMSFNADAMVWSGEVALGVETVEQLRKAGRYEGPVIFIGDVPPSWHRRIDEIHAAIVTDPSAALAVLMGLRMPAGASTSGPSSSAPRYS